MTSSQREIILVKYRLRLQERLAEYSGLEDGRLAVTALMSALLSKRDQPVMILPSLIILFIPRQFQSSLEHRTEIPGAQINKKS